MDQKICGTYWLIATKSGNKFVSQGEKPVRSGETWRKHPKNMGWLQVEPTAYPLSIHNLAVTLKGDIVTSSDYKDISFPDISFDDEPMEIEIGKSGRVYTYES